MIMLLCAALIFSYVYEDSDSLLVDNDTLTICGNHQYALKVHIKNNSELFVRAATGAPDTTGWLVFNAPLIVITDSSSINGSERGFQGAYMNSHPWGYGPGGGGTGGVSGGAGGGGAYGGDGGMGGDYSGGAGGVAYGDSADTLIEMGSGGGAGRLSVLDGAGGNGGSAVTLCGGLVELDSSSITVDGQIGYDGSVEAGGGGAGGGIFIWADTVDIHHCTMTADGANGGNTMGFGGGGGGGGGRIKILYASFVDTSDVTCSVQGGAAGLGDTTLPTSTPGNPGSVYISAFTGICELAIEHESMLRIIPNPSRNIVTICFNDVPVTVMLYDASGRMVKELRLLAQPQSIDLGELSPGIYFLRIDGSSLPLNKIIIVQ